MDFVNPEVLQRVIELFQPDIVIDEIVERQLFLLSEENLEP